MSNAYGWLAIIPPLLAIAMAILSKEVYTSLLLGIVSGFFILVNFAPGAAALSLPDRLFFKPLEEIINNVIAVTSDPNNTALLLFLALLGGVIAVLTAAGGTRSLEKWSKKHIHTRRKAQLSAFGLGCFIFIDDYFNSLTVGSMMRPITDEQRISRAKLAYIIDSTAAPVTILFPVSSWVATIITMITPTLMRYGFSEVGIGAFMSSVPYNFYAWLTLVMVATMILLQLDIGPMKKYERTFLETGEDISCLNENEEVPFDDRKKSVGMFGMFFLILFLVAAAFAAMLATGGFFSGQRDMAAALTNCNASISLVYSGVLTLLMMAVMFIPRKILNLKEFVDAFIGGAKSMIPAVMMLIFAWTFASVLSEDFLGTGVFIASLVVGTLPAFLLAFVIFLLTSFISFTTGVSWGTMAIMLPTSITICAAVQPEHIAAVLGAAIAGAIFGDHCSPLADTTILSSAGANCIHLDHVMSQLPYALIVACFSALGYLISGFVNNPYIPLFSSGILMVLSMIALKRWQIRKRI